MRLVVLALWCILSLLLAPIVGRAISRNEPPPQA